MNKPNSSGSIWSGLKRGLAGLCPQCGEGRLFSRYLKVKSTCDVCKLSLAQYKSDDGPAYFTILIVGHLIIAPMLFLEFIRSWPVEYVLMIMISSIVGLALALLPRVKGAFVGVQWAVGDTSPR